MRLVVDTNRLFAALVKDSTSRDIILHLKAELISLNFSKEEIARYKDQILKKANINEEEFFMVLRTLLQKLVIIDDAAVMSRISEAAQIMDKIDPDDTPFIAAALATEADIWSDDKHFDKQNRIKVWKTKSLVDYF